MGTEILTVQLYVAGLYFYNCAMVGKNICVVALRHLYYSIDQQYDSFNIYNCVYFLAHLSICK